MRNIRIGIRLALPVLALPFLLGIAGPAAADPTATPGTDSSAGSTPVATAPTADPLATTSGATAPAPTTPAPTTTSPDPAATPTSTSPVPTATSPAADDALSVLGATTPADATPSDTATAPTPDTRLTATGADGHPVVQAAPTDTITVRGTGFPAGASGTVSLSPGPHLADVTADAAGAFTVEVTVPVDTASGTYALTANLTDPATDQDVVGSVDLVVAAELLDPTCPEDTRLGEDGTCVPDGPPASPTASPVEPEATCRAAYGSSQDCMETGAPAPTLGPGDELPVTGGNVLPPTLGVLLLVGFGAMLLTGRRALTR